MKNDFFRGRRNSMEHRMSRSEKFSGSYPSGWIMIQLIFSEHFWTMSDSVSQISSSEAYIQDYSQLSTTRNYFIAGSCYANHLSGKNSKSSFLLQLHKIMVVVKMSGPLSIVNKDNRGATCSAAFVSADKCPLDVQQCEKPKASSSARSYPGGWRRMVNEWHRTILAAIWRMQMVLACGARTEKNCRNLHSFLVAVWTFRTSIGHNVLRNHPIFFKKLTNWILSTIFYSMWDCWIAIVAKRSWKNVKNDEKCHCTFRTCQTSIGHKNFENNRKWMKLWQWNPCKYRCVNNGLLNCKTSEKRWIM